ncbi:MAG: ATP-dependent Clp protease adaptor ClpS [Epulopiscium sp. Nuni2H_MBin003]|nr:MAG: ATP-dependent Clp protease adaptor ClpS [Epulopiscium sp. Nuni2H_MBin003]
MATEYKQQLNNKLKIKQPKKYMAIMYNDDYTTMEFVVSILEDIFLKSSEEAYSIMMNVHKKGSGIAGIYPVDIALTKINKSMLLAKENNFPFKMTIKEIE